MSVLASAPGQGEDVLPQSAAVHFTYEDEAQLFERFGLWRQTGATVLGFDEPIQLEAMNVTAGALPTLRVTPALGRLFSAADDTAGAPGTVVLSHGYWLSQFGGDEDVVGETIEVGGRPREVIGVLPRGFRFMDHQPALYLPFRYDRSTLTVSNFTLSSFARLKPGVTLDAATADLARLLPRAVEKFPGGLTLEFLEEARATPLLRPLRDSIIGDVGTVLWILLGYETRSSGMSARCSGSCWARSELRCSSHARMSPTCSSYVPKDESANWPSRRLSEPVALASPASCSSRAWYSAYWEASAGSRSHSAACVSWRQWRRPISRDSTR